MSIELESMRHAPRSMATKALVAASVATLVVGLAAIAAYAIDVFLLLFAGILVAVFLRSLGWWVHRLVGLPMSWSVMVVVALLMAAVGVAGWLMGGQLAQQYQQLSEQLPQSLQKLQEQLKDHPWGRRLFEHAPTLERATTGRVDPFSRITGMFSGTLGAIGNVVVVLFIGLYGALDPGTYTRGLLRLVPLARRERVREVLGGIGGALRGWLIGRAFSMTVVGVGTTIGLWLLGIPLALTLGLLAAAFGFIPYIGPLVSAIPALLLALLDGPQQALYVGLLYLGIQLIESYVLTPLVEQEVVALPPALTITMMLLLGVLVGGLGLALAAPLTACVLVLIKMLYVEDTLGDSLEQPVRDLN